MHGEAASLDADCGGDSLVAVAVTRASPSRGIAPVGNQPCETGKILVYTVYMQDLYRKYAH